MWTSHLPVCPAISLLPHPYTRPVHDRVSIHASDLPSVHPAVSKRASGIAPLNDVSPHWSTQLESCVFTLTPAQSPDRPSRASTAVSVARGPGAIEVRRLSVVSHTVAGRRRVNSAEWAARHQSPVQLNGKHLVGNDRTPAPVQRDANDGVRTDRNRSEYGDRKRIERLDGETDAETECSLYSNERFTYHATLITTAYGTLHTPSAAT